MLNRGVVWGARVLEGIRGVEWFALFRSFCWWAVQRFESSLPVNTKIPLHYMGILCTFRRKHALNAFNHPCRRQIPPYHRKPESYLNSSLFAHAVVKVAGHSLSVINISISNVGSAVDGLFNSLKVVDPSRSVIKISFSVLKITAPSHSIVKVAGISLVEVAVMGVHA